MTVSIALTVWGSMWLVNNVLAPPNLRDLLAMRGRLPSGQQK
jgi:hypothetical protein